MLITKLYRNKWRANTSSKLVDSEVAVIEGHFGDYS